MIRYQVIRKEIRFNRHTYHAGEMLPESFSEKDKYRVLYPSRIAKVEVPDAIDVSSPSVAEQKMVVAGMTAKATQQAQAPINAKVPVSAVNPTGVKMPATAVNPLQKGVMQK